MTFLLNTNILSEPTKRSPDERAMKWLANNEGEWGISSVALAEVRFGILMLPEGQRRARLEEWFAEVVETVPTLAWDTAMALRWAEVVAATRKQGLNLGIKDTMIAACALVRDLTVATRNVNDFKPTGVRIVNPYE